MFAIVSPDLARRVYEIVEGGRHGARLGHWFDSFLGLVILLATGVAIASTEPGIEPWQPLLTGLEWLCTVIFAVEYGLRVWVAPFHRHMRYQRGWRGRLRYMASAMAIIDLGAFVPLAAAQLVAIPAGTLLLLRCLRLLKLLRYFSAFETLGQVVNNERKPLLAAATLMVIVLVLLSAGGYLLEKDAQPEHFGSVMSAMWWGIVTLSTVGYGDVVPVTPAGKVLGGIAVVVGMGMFALPAGILATGFAEEMRRRNFVVTWTLVAKVPFFERLPAIRIAEIVGLLESRSANSGEAIVIKNDPADGMFFIVDGEVEVVLPNRRIHLASGDFFGELALISNQPRTADVVARTFCQLLKLRTDHFHRLMADHPDLANIMHEVARKRGLDEQRARHAPPAKDTAPAG